MKKNLQKRKGFWVALVAACMLVLQIASAPSLYAGIAEQASLDAFGNPLCLSADHGRQAQDPATDHSQMPDCCTLVCGASAHLALSGRLLYSFEVPPPSYVLFSPRGDAPDLRLRPEQFEGSPRAPPGLA